MAITNNDCRRIVHRTRGGHGVGTENTVYEQHGVLLRIEDDRAIVVYDGCVGADNVPLAEIEEVA